MFGHAGENIAQILRYCPIFDHQDWRTFTGSRSVNQLALPKWLYSNDKKRGWRHWHLMK